jgi:hypothetical protein
LGAGTYEILICKSSCPVTGDENVLIRGRLVLFPMDLTQPDLARIHSSHFSHLGRQVPNACFALDKLQGRTYAGYAGIDKEGLTAWSIEGDELHFALYHSPDAGYKVTAQRTTMGFDGTGRSSGVGVAAPVGLSPDKVIARRIGDADMGQCRLQPEPGKH